jgi:hypothetical protein
MNGYYIMILLQEYRIHPKHGLCTRKPTPALLMIINPVIILFFLHPAARNKWGRTVTESGGAGG